MDSVIISVLALVATFYQLYLQRIHNEKSLKPLIQINLTDYQGLLYVHLQNNGVGPFIVEKLTFLKGDKKFSTIQECLTISPKEYQHIPITQSVRKVVPSGAYLEIFSIQFKADAPEQNIDDVRRELASLELKVDGRDIYNNKISTERPLTWFTRHL